MKHVHAQHIALAKAWDERDECRKKHTQPEKEKLDAEAENDRLQGHLQALQAANMNLEIRARDAAKQLAAVPTLRTQIGSLQEQVRRPKETKEQLRRDVERLEKLATTIPEHLRQLVVLHTKIEDLELYVAPANRTSHTARLAQKAREEELKKLKAKVQTLQADVSRDSRAASAATEVQKAAETERDEAMFQHAFLRTASGSKKKSAPGS
jgi:chromosome segregation ATPase